MRKEGGIEIQAEATLFGPLDPRFKMLGFELGSLHWLARGFRVTGVEIHSVPTRDQPQGTLEIGTELIGRSSLARVISRDGQAAIERTAASLEAADIIPL